MTHNMCHGCWYATQDGTPVRIVNDERTKCCFCGDWNDDGIYVKSDADIDCDHR